MISKRKSFIYSFLSAIAGSALTFGVCFGIIRADRGNTGDGSSKIVCPTSNPSIVSVDHAYRFIHPILSVESGTESESYATLKASVEQYLKSEKTRGLLSASVYVKRYSNSSWFAINEKERYDPGSLLKVGVLITYLRMAETDKDLLEKQVVYRSQPGFVFPVEHYMSDTIKEGHSYTIGNLLTCMIENSDNRATVFLEDHMDTTVFKKEFADLGITTPRFDDPNFTLNIHEYSMMFNALYNAGYLRKKASDDALAMLADSKFRQGILKGLPGNVIVAHKYGEYGNDAMHELHESGIVYLNNDPYLISVMTRGTDWNELSGVLGHVSELVYQFQNAHH